MNKKQIKILLSVLLFAFLALSSVEAKGKAIVLPTPCYFPGYYYYPAYGGSYALVGGSYLWPVYGYYSVHPVIVPEEVKSVVYLPTWNGVFWSYEYVMIPKKSKRK